MSKEIRSPFKMSTEQREIVREKMIELSLNKAYEAELTAEYYDSISSKEKTKESKAQFKVHADGLRDSAKQQREMAEFLLNCK